MDFHSPVRWFAVKAAWTAAFVGLLLGPAAKCRGDSLVADACRCRLRGLLPVHADA
jgi:hypothetical protein